MDDIAAVNVLKKIIPNNMTKYEITFPIIECGVISP